MRNPNAGETDQKTVPWQEVAWAGIRFRVPAMWQVWEIGPRYLLLGDTAGPVFEVKWNKIRGYFAHETVLRRLTAMHPKKGRRHLQTEALPAAWEAALGGFKARGFSWTSGGQGGVGALMYHPLWQTAVMVQFFHRPEAGALEVQAQVLASFRQSRRDKTALWSVFDLRAEIPEAFVLKRHRFNVGAFELAFAGPMGRLCLYRRGPAGLLLDHQGLAEFGVSLDGFVRGRLIDRPDGTDCQADWVMGPDGGPVRRFWHRITAALPYAQCRLWVPRGYNQILGVRIESRAPVSDDLMEAICSGYGLVS